MPEVSRLDGGGFPVSLDSEGSSLEAPDLVGNVIAIDLDPVTGRAGTNVYADRLDDALKNSQIGYHKLFEIEVEDDGMRGAVPAGRANALAEVTRQGEPAILLRVPPLAAGSDCAVLYTNESGESRWIWPQPASTTAPHRGAGGGEIVFYLPRPSGSPPPPSAPSSTAANQRGTLTKLGRRVVRVLYWATDEIVGLGARKAAELWENKKRPYAFRSFPSLTDTNVPWNTMTSGRALLWVHGTFSSAASAFAEVPVHIRDALLKHYNGRIFAFDHPSLHHSPQENVDRFFQMLPEDVHLDLDLISHSRGGLVARELIERQHSAVALNRKVQVGKAVFVASPNLGTKLSDGNHGTDLLDAYTNLLTELPDNAFSYTIEGILALVKIIAHGSLAGLPGLNCMLPNGDYLQSLNVNASYKTAYYAVASNFKPQGEGLAGRFAAFLKGGLLERLFGEENDGVVPTRGCHDGVPQPASFPVPGDRRLLFGPGDNIHHCNYFGDEQLNAHLLKWLMT